MGLSTDLPAFRSATCFHQGFFCVGGGGGGRQTHTDTDRTAGRQAEAQDCVREPLWAQGCVETTLLLQMVQAALPASVGSGQYGCTGICTTPTRVTWAVLVLQIPDVFVLHARSRSIPRASANTPTVIHCCF